MPSSLISIITLILVHHLFSHWSNRLSTTRKTTWYLETKTGVQGLSFDEDFAGEKGDSGLVVLNLGCSWNYQERFRKHGCLGSALRNSSLIGQGMAWGLGGCNVKFRFRTTKSEKEDSILCSLTSHHQHSNWKSGQNSCTSMQDGNFQRLKKKLNRWEINTKSMKYKSIVWHYDSQLSPVWQMNVSILYNNHSICIKSNI